MTERDDRGPPSGHVVLPGHTGHWPTESHVHRRCPACGEYFRTDDLAINVDHRGCQRAKAPDTGRPRPTWRLDGRLCLGRASGCENHPDNQYVVMAYRGGTYRACGRSGVCGEVAVDN